MIAQPSNSNTADQSSSRKALPAWIGTDIFAVAALNADIGMHMQQLGSQQSMVKAEVSLRAVYVEKHINFMC